MKKTLLCILLLLFILVSAGLAQKNEVAVTVGGYFPHNSPVDAGNAFTAGGNIAHRVASVPFLSLYVEVPVYGVFNSTSDIINAAQSPSRAKYSGVFVTPGLKLKLAPSFPISPYVAVGGGLAHFSITNGASSSTNSGVFDAAGGIDWKIAPFLSFRAELRDYYSGTPQLVPNIRDRQNQLLATGGLVLRF